MHYIWAIHGMPPSIYGMPSSLTSQTYVPASCLSTASIRSVFEVRLFSPLGNRLSWKEKEKKFKLLAFLDPNIVSDVEPLRFCPCMRAFRL